MEPGPLLNIVTTSSEHILMVHYIIVDALQQLDSIHVLRNWYSCSDSSSVFNINNSI